MNMISGYNLKILLRYGFERNIRLYYQPYLINEKAREKEIFLKLYINLISPLRMFAEI